MLAISIVAYVVMGLVTSRRLVGNFKMGHEKKYYSLNFGTDDYVFCWLFSLCLSTVWPLMIVPAYAYAYMDTMGDGTKNFFSSLLAAPDPANKQKEKAERQVKALTQAVNGAYEDRAKLHAIEHDTGVITEEEYKAAMALARKERDDKLPRTGFSDRRLSW